MIDQTELLPVNKGRIVVRVTRSEMGENETITFRPSNTKEDTFVKYLPNGVETAYIDITPYCESMWSNTAIKDIYDSIGSGDAFDGIPYRAVIFAEIEGFNFSSQPLYRNMKNGQNTLMTKLPYLQIPLGMDYIPLYFTVLASDDSNIFVDFGSGEERIRSVGEPTILHLYYDLIEQGEIPKDVTIEDRVSGYGVQVLPLKTIPVGMNTRRLVWLNEVGGVDTWHFEFLRESSFATASDVFYSSTNGYTRTNRKSERTHIIETRELDDITASVVAYVIASPEVYLEENGMLTPIDIVTEECRTYSDTELSSIQVAYRLKEREL